MNVGRTIVANILREKEPALQQFLSAGFDLAWMTSTKDLSRAAVFGDADRAAYQFYLAPVGGEARGPVARLFPA